MKDALLDDEGRRAVLTATVVSGLLVAHQAAGRATRDAFFLSNFPVAFLPVMMMASSAASIVAVAAFSRVLARRSPFRVLPALAALSSVLLLAEWLLSLEAPGAAAIAVYLHLAFFGGALLSGHWSLINERFDPYTAKRVVGRIGFGGSLGAVAGGFLAWGASRVIAVPAMLLVMASLTMAAAIGMVRFGRGHISPTPTAAADPAPPALATLRRVPYLRDLALVVALGAVTDGLLDYVLKSEAAATFTQPSQLMSFFAIIGTAFGLFSLVVQTGLSRTSLRTLGLAGTAAVRPATVLLMALLGLLDPRMWVAVLARAGQDINTSSLFRSAYELLFTPLPESEKRPTKAVVDVAFDKLGSLAGGALALLAVAIVPSQTARLLFGLASVLCIASLAFTGRLHRGYVRTLEQSLRAGKVRLEIDEVPDEASRLTLAHTGLALDRETLLKEINALRDASKPPGEATDPARAADPLLQAIVDLRSGEKSRVRSALRRVPEPPPEVVAHLIPLLARDELFLDVLRVLRRVSSQVTGQLLDALLDPRADPAVRRRLPRVLKACLTRRAVDGLFLGLGDSRPDVRAQCALALASITSRQPELSVARADVFTAVRLEVKAAGGGLELDHVFTLLALTLEREPLQIALRALRGADRGLRGTALEYLENVLPDDVRKELWPFLGEQARQQPRTRPPQDVVNELLSSSAAIPFSRAALRARLPHRDRSEKP